MKDETMKAKHLLERFKHTLIGKTVNTERIGAWPGGPAEVIQIRPDRSAPEIVFQVRHKHCIDPENTSRYWEIGVFEHEEVTLTTE